MSDKVWSVWVHEGKCWRMLAYYTTRTEARRTKRIVELDGELAVVTHTGDETDMAIRNGSYQPSI